MCALAFRSLGMTSPVLVLVARGIATAAVAGETGNNIIAPDGAAAGLNAGAWLVVGVSIRAHVRSMACGAKAETEDANTSSSPQALIGRMIARGKAERSTRAEDARARARQRSPTSGGMSECMWVSRRQV